MKLTLLALWAWLTAAQTAPPPLVPLDKLTIPKAEEGVTDADQPQAASLNGNALFGVRDKEGLISASMATLQKDPSNPDLRLAAGRTIDAFLRFTESIPIYSDGIGRFPKDYRFPRLRGQRHISIRYFREAIADLENAVRLAPNSFDAAYYLGLAYYFQGEHDRAAASFARCEAQTEKPLASKADLLGGRSCETIRQDPNVLLPLQYWHYLALRRSGNREAARDTHQPHLGSA